MAYKINHPAIEIVPVHVDGDRLRAELAGSLGRVWVKGFIVKPEQAYKIRVRRPMSGGEALFMVPEWVPVGVLTPVATMGFEHFNLGILHLGGVWTMEFLSALGEGEAPELFLACEEVW